MYKRQTGLRLQEATDALEGFGTIYKKMSIASGVIPQITACLLYTSQILTLAGANTTSISSSRRDATTTSFRAGLNRRGAEPARTVPGLWLSLIQI